MLERTRQTTVNRERTGYKDIRQTSADQWTQSWEELQDKNMEKNCITMMLGKINL
jgi:hypothetical protein